MPCCSRFSTSGLAPMERPACTDPVAGMRASGHHAKAIPPDFQAGFDKPKRAAAHGEQHHVGQRDEGLTEGARSQQPTDAIAQAQTPKDAAVERPEQKKTAHDLSDVFNPSDAVPSSEALTNQTDHGQMNGFDFYRDPLGATRPGMTFEDFYRAGVTNKAAVGATQRRLLESRYNLEPRLDPVVTMSRGKPIAVGPTAKLPAGMTWKRWPR
jgi:hypothetical protein